MVLSSTSHAYKAGSVASLLQAQPKANTRKADNDADDAPAAKPKLATSGPGQILDRKV